MAYVQVLNQFSSANWREREALIREMNSLRTELDDIRAKYTALVALLVAATTLGAGYGTGTALNAKTFTPT